ncbi:MAG: hypothetical protein ACAH83_17360 [Alphaproteobacteria bacterium]
MMKCRWHKATMSLKQQRLYNIMGRTMASDMEKGEVTFTVPAESAPADVAKVRRQFELENALPVKFVDAPVPKRIDMPAALAELKGIFTTTVAELHAIGDTTTRGIKADLQGIYLPAASSAGAPVR